MFKNTFPLNHQTFTLYIMRDNHNIFNIKQPKFTIQFYIKNKQNKKSQLYFQGQKREFVCVFFFKKIICMSIFVFFAQIFCREAIKKYIFYFLQLFIQQRITKNVHNIIEKILNILFSYKIFVYEKVRRSSWVNRLTYYFSLN